MIKTLKRWLSHHKNHQIGTYMDRWYLIPPQWGLPISVRLQHIKRPDGERLPHNHPYAFKSIVLKGWYDEEQTKDWTKLSPLSDQAVFQRDVVRHSRFKLFRIAQKQYHRIISMPESGVWTIIWHPRKPQEYSWGYLNVDGTHIPHADYVRPPGYDLPYKAAAYRRDGPVGRDGPGGPGHADEPGKVGEPGEPGDRGPGGPSGSATGSFEVELRGSLEVEVVNTANKEWFITEEILPVQVSPTAEARIKKFLAEGGKIKGERI